MSRTAELRAAVGSPRAVLRKLIDAIRTVFNLLNPWERRRRFQRLQALGLAGEQPTVWQLVIGSYHMLTQFLLPSNVQFYEHYEQGHWWQQVLRFLDEPSAMLDPVGIGASLEMVIWHLVQVTHTSAGYDVALVCMHENGLETLRGHLMKLRDGTHPRQAALEAIIEKPDYPQKLLEALDRFEEDPEANWQVITYPTPEGCEELFDWGVDRFGTPGRFFAYCRTLAPAPWSRRPKLASDRLASV